MSCGIRIDTACREAADYVDRITQGEKASDVPLMQPVQFELLTNARTARALGISLPPSFLARADEVIE